jgi:hypothetical protein
VVDVCGGGRLLCHAEQREQYETVVCYEVKSGHEVWVHRDRAYFHEATGDEGPRATPTVHRAIYASDTGILNCLRYRRPVCPSTFEERHAESSVWFCRVATGS